MGCSKIGIMLVGISLLSCGRSSAPLVSSMRTEGLHHKWAILSAGADASMPNAYIDLRDVYRSGAAAGCRYLLFTPKFGHHNRMEAANISGPLSHCNGDSTGDWIEQRLQAVYSFVLRNDQLQLLDRNGHLLISAKKPADDDDASISRKWVIQQMINADNDQLVKSKAYIDFTSMPAASAGVGCNRFSFNLSAKEGYKIAVGKIAGTKMYCTAAARNEEVLAKVLLLINTYQVIGNRIKLFDAQNTLLIEGVAAL